MTQIILDAFHSIIFNNVTIVFVNIKGFREVAEVTYGNLRDKRKNGMDQEGKRIIRDHII
jgi:hypothetical protein